MHVTVAITSCGGEIIPGIIDCLRAEESYEFDIIGVDMSDDAVGQKFVDEFYTVPGGLDDEYISKMIKIAEAESVDVVVPLSDQETRSLSQHKDEFQSIGTEILTPDGWKVETSSDKGSMLEYLDENGVETPEFYLPQSLSDLDQAVSSLGYPENDVVMKPRQQRASRGFWILSRDRNPKDLVLNERCLQTLPYETIRGLLDDGGDFPALVVMEYLEGDDFSVDCLSVNGSSIYQVPTRRIEPSAGPVQFGKTTHDKKVQLMCEEICNSFEFNHNVNIDIAYADDEKTGDPLVYEINPRISGLIAVNRAADINLLLYGILNVMNQNIPKDLDFKEVQFHRCHQDIYK